MKPHLGPVAGVLALLTVTSAAPAQTPNKPARVGMLVSTACGTAAYSVLLDELRKLGWVEGRTLTVDCRAAEGRAERLPQLAAELVSTKPDLIVANSPQPARAAKDATSTVPIVMLFVADPVGVGLAQSLARPGGNLTGVATAVPEGIIAKQVQVLRELLPGGRRVAALLNPSNEVTRRIFPAQAPAAAAQLGLQIDIVEVGDKGGIADAVARVKAGGADALWVVGDPIFHDPNYIPALAAKAKLPALYLPRAMVEAGGLISYGADFDAISRRGAQYVDRVLRGANPADLPIEQPTKFELVINQKTARALGLDIPPSLLARADEVIE